MCHGYIFGKSAQRQSVARQLGCCGCVIATEMELCDAMRPSPRRSTALINTKRAVQGVQAKILQSMLMAGERGTTGRAELYYLERDAMKSNNLRAEMASRRSGSRANVTRQMLTRHRLPKSPPSRMAAKVK